MNTNVASWALSDLNKPSFLDDANGIIPWGCTFICGSREKMHDSMALVPIFLFVSYGTMPVGVLFVAHRIPMKVLHFISLTSIMEMEVPKLVNAKILFFGIYL